jgi:uncharacterized protein (TIRG00374 family)
VRRTRWQFLAGAALAALLLVWSLRDVQWDALARSLAGANYWLFPAACALTLLHFWVRALRWGVLLSTVKHIPRGSLFSATMIGYAANNLLPARLGEFARAWAIGRREQISRSAAFATVVVERIVDVFSLLFFFGLTLLLHPFGESTKQVGWLLLGVNLAALVALVIAERHPHRVEQIAFWISARAPQRVRPRVRSLLGNFVLGLGVLRQGPAIARVIAYSFLLYAVTLGGIEVCLRAFDFQVPWYASVILLVAVTLGFIVAPTPGYVGAIQAACVWGLGIFGVDSSRAFSFSVFYHVSQFVPVTAVGLWCLAKQGLSLGQVAGVAGKEVKETA